MDKLSIRTVSIDYAKGIGIIFVVFGHVILLRDGRIGSNALPNLPEWIYSFHMPLFFVINGVLLGLKGSLRINVKNKFLTYMIPYFFWSGVYIFLLLIANPKSWRNIVLERGYATLTGRGIAPLWFLSSLFFANVLLSECSKLVVKCGFIDSKITWGGVIITIITVCCIAKFYIEVSDAHQILIYPIVSFARTLLAALFILVGYYIGFHWKLFNGRVVCRVVPIISTVVILLTQGLSQNHVNMHTYSFDSIIVFFITGVFGSLSVITICNLLPTTLNWLSELGRASLDVMALHYPPIPTLSLIIKASYYIINEVYLIHAIIMTVLCICCVYLIHILIIDKIRWKCRRTLDGLHFVK